MQSKLLNETVWNLPNIQSANPDFPEILAEEYISFITCHLLSLYPLCERSFHLKYQRHVCLKDPKLQSC